MTRVRRIKTLDEAALAGLTDHATMDLLYAEKYKIDLLSRSVGTWVISRDDGTPAFVFGVLNGTMLGSHEVWFLAYSGLRFNIRPTMKFARRGLRRLASMYGILSAHVDPSFPETIRLAKHFGFHYAGKLEVAEDKVMDRYELRASWLLQ
jgi:hypothetical protein